MTTISNLRTRLGRQILICNFSLIVIVLVYYFLGGFDSEELTSLLTLLTAISAIYVGALFKYIGENVTKKPSTNEIQKELNIFAGKFVLWVVPIHFFLLFGVISAKAFAFIPFQDMNMLLGIIEMLLGGYMGLIINRIFDSDK